MNKKNKLIALSVLSAMSLTSVSPLAINSFSNVIALQGDQTVNKGTVVMNQDTTIKYLDTNTDPADGTQAKINGDNIQDGHVLIKMAITLL